MSPARPNVAQASRRSGLALGLAHELGVATAVSSSIVLVLLGGELPLFAWLVALAPWLSCALALSRRQVPALSGTLIGIGGVAFGAATFAQGGVETAVLAFAEVLLGLVAGRTLVRRTRAHDTQALGLSVVLILAGSVLNVSVSFFPLFVLYAIAAVWALATRQLLAGAEQAGVDEAVLRARTDVVTPAFFAGTAAVSLGVLAAATVLFLMFPRVGLGDIGAFMKRQNRLPSSVGLRGDPRALGGNEVVARVEGLEREEWDEGLYLRGVVYDVVTLDGFSQSEQGARVFGRGGIELAPAREKARPYVVSVAPSIGDRALVLGATRYARTLSGGRVNAMLPVAIAGRNGHDELVTSAPLDAPMRYEVMGEIAAPSFVPREARNANRPATLDRADPRAATFYALPPGFDEELAKLAAREAKPAPTEDARDLSAEAAALRGYLLSNFQYGLDAPRFADRPLRTFLLEERHGHCEFFAAAFALLLRSRGIAARVVGGYQGGAWDEGIVVFQQRHAHAWVEWFMPGVGWIVDDATPVPSAPREVLSGIDSVVERVRRLWDERILDFALEDQLAALTRARRARLDVVPLAGALVVAVLALAVVAGLRRRRRSSDRRDTGAPLARAIVETAERVGRAPIAPSATLREAVAAVPDRAEARPALDAALAVYEQTRFGGSELPEAELKLHLRALRRARQSRESRP